MDSVWKMLPLLAVAMATPASQSGVSVADSVLGELTAFLAALWSAMLFTVVTLVIQEYVRDWVQDALTFLRGALR